MSAGRLGHRLGGVAVVILAVGAAVAACDAGGGTSTSGAAVGAGTAQAGAGGAGGGAVDLTTVAATGAGGIGDVCEEAEFAAEPVPLDLILVLDRSGSVETNGLWSPLVGAIGDFLQSPGSAGIDVGITFYPEQGYDDCPPGYLACQEGIYGSDGALQVPLTTLPAGEASLLSALSEQSAEGECTPTYGALLGTLDYAMAHQDATPGRQTVVVLAAEGDFDGCAPSPVDANDAEVIAQLASNALFYNGVRTFAIAIQGASVSELDKIAVAGGTEAAYDVTVDVSAFAEKLAQIRGRVLACDFLIPAQGSEPFDPGRVNVVYHPGNGAESQKIPQAASSLDCGDEAGWYYDNPASATSISLCPASCALVQADTMADVTVAFGCPTIVK